MRSSGRGQNKVQQKMTGNTQIILNDDFILPDDSEDDSYEVSREQWHSEMGELKRLGNSRYRPLSEEQKSKKRLRENERNKNRTEKEKEKRRKRTRIIALTPQQIDEKKARNRKWYANLTPEQKKQRQEKKKMNAHKKKEQNRLELELEIAEDNPGILVSNLISETIASAPQEPIRRSQRIAKNPNKRKRVTIESSGEEPKAKKHKRNQPNSSSDYENENPINDTSINSINVEFLTIESENRLDNNVIDSLPTLGVTETQLQDKITELDRRETELNEAKAQLERKKQELHIEREILYAQIREREQELADRQLEYEAVSKIKEMEILKQKNQSISDLQKREAKLRETEIATHQQLLETQHTHHQKMQVDLEELEQKKLTFEADINEATRNLQEAEDVLEQKKLAFQEKMNKETLILSETKDLLEKQKNMLATKEKQNTDRLKKWEMRLQKEQAANDAAAKQNQRLQQTLSRDSEEIIAKEERFLIKKGDFEKYRDEQLFAFKKEEFYLKRLEEELQTKNNNLQSEKQQSLNLKSRLEEEQRIFTANKKQQKEIFKIEQEKINAQKEQIKIQQEEINNSVAELNIRQKNVDDNEQFLQEEEKRLQHYENQLRYRANEIQAHQAQGEEIEENIRLYRERLDKEMAEKLNLYQAQIAKLTEQLKMKDLAITQAQLEKSVHDEAAIPSLNRDIEIATESNARNVTPNRRNAKSKARTTKTPSNSTTSHPTRVIPTPKNANLASKNDTPGTEKHDYRLLFMDIVKSYIDLSLLERKNLEKIDKSKMRGIDSLEKNSEQFNYIKRCTQARSLGNQLFKRGKYSELRRPFHSLLDSKMRRCIEGTKQKDLEVIESIKFVDESKLEKLELLSIINDHIVNKTPLPATQVAPLPIAQNLNRFGILFSSPPPTVTSNNTTLFYTTGK